MGNTGDLKKCRQETVLRRIKINAPTFISNTNINNSLPNFDLTFASVDGPTLFRPVA